MPYTIPDHLKGLNDQQVQASRKQYGANRIDAGHKSTGLELILHIAKEPMLILLFAITLIYVIIGNYGEALFMLLAIVAVSAISFYQDNRSKRALEALEKLNEPLSTLVRNNEVVQVPTKDIVVGDLCITEEGKMINADGMILHSHDFSVNEAALTGESLSVFKNSDSDDNRVYSGTLSVSGLAVFKVDKIGAETRLGKIGSSLSGIKEEISPLQLQIRQFVKAMAIIGVVIFLLVCIVNYYHSRSLLSSLLNGLTLAMSVLPEEIPVAFTTFMALGAWKLMREGIIIKRSSIVETLGSTTVICTDKTGTITENTMHLKQVYAYPADRVYDEAHFGDAALRELMAYAMWSSEPVPFDPMEKTLHRVYEQTQAKDERAAYTLFHEYPLEGKPPMMTHLFENAAKNRIIAAKGAPEAILQVSTLAEAEREKLRKQVSVFGQQGYRVLGVAKSQWEGSLFPEKQQDFPFEFLGLLVFYDPPKKGIREVFRQIHEAGIQVKVITGDNTETTKSIAAQAGIIDSGEAMEGNAVLSCPAQDLPAAIRQKVLFTRMFPEAKLAVVNALKQNGEVVAMLGDGVNDAPALKAAHIGVAMGSKGTEIAKAAASLVIIDDDLSKLLTGIAAGRRIYANIKKAVQYIISIHIPIILTVSLPLFLNWAFPQIFMPVHVIFLELIMGPTCSIVYENEPMERNMLLKKPRKMTETFLNWKELGISIVQGLLITAGVLLAYQWMARGGADEKQTRAMVFTTLIFANILLSLSNRSFYYSLFESAKNRNRLFPVMMALTLGLLFAILYIEPFAAFFQVSPLKLSETGLAALIAALSVLWFEGYKYLKRRALIGAKAR